MEIIMHQAAQYLATASISFLDKKEDDSHTNLGWSNNGLRTHPFLNGDTLNLNYSSFSLEWVYNNGNIEHLLLENAKHQDIVKWITEVSKAADFSKSYRYKLHYELPYKTISDGYVFKLEDQHKLESLIKKRNIAQQGIANILLSNGFNSDIRIWPHHFDTGAFVILNDKISIEFGMAIPDTLINAFYLYVSGYKSHQAIDLSPSFKPKSGTYFNDGWKGIALPLNGIDENSATNFYQNSINHYLNHKS